MASTDTRVALITGGAQGLGLAIAERLSRHARCVLLDMHPEVAEVAASLPGGAMGLRADVSDEAGIAAAIARVEQECGRLDILVNNAGIHPYGSVEDIAQFDSVSLEDWQRLLQINLTGMFIVTKAALPLMRRGGWGRIVNMSSRTGRTYTGTASIAYATAKAGVIALTRQTAGIEGPNGITANCIAPGSVRTPLTSREGEEGIARRAARTVVGRIGEPSDVAATVAFLASEDAGYITGATIDVNGGSSMM
ncbi:SDR family NAD(P)-dependent oxidoreductase [Salipiger mucosus]|uniref:3-oxoacyl-[acyl-carrier protein] reductase n=1 Tax=Salipiger mucosus DSM 16094 TaxID=1123237 RepID=S9RCG5_9RHOB|nr:SDR family NAD(P)-dependent oxidoreductase [Salipiger mucosus]EPX75820.1 3-oxoacyl-[acyl-carrier protein] reductase [Salipiger mucosus DSM 16094]